MYLSGTIYENIMPVKKIPTIVIEDSEVDLWLITFMLKNVGDIELLNSAKSGPDGIKMIEKYKPELIFLDLDLPGLSGIEVARLVRKKKIETSIVFVTSFEQYANEVQEFKPFWEGSDPKNHNVIAVCRFFSKPPKCSSGDYKLC